MTVAMRLTCMSLALEKPGLIRRSTVRFTIMGANFPRRRRPAAARSRFSGVTAARHGYGISAPPWP